MVNPVGPNHKRLGTKSSLHAKIYCKVQMKRLQQSEIAKPNLHVITAKQANTVCGNTKRTFLTKRT